MKRITTQLNTASLYRKVKLKARSKSQYIRKKLK